jgi:hypothetical protein
MVNEKLCTVCGYEMEEGPRDYNICPSCGTEFGLHDVNSSVRDLREVWLESGPQWSSRVIPQPQNWQPLMQLAGLLMEQAKIAVIYSGSDSQGVIVSKTDFVVADSGWESSYGQRELQSA